MPLAVDVITLLRKRKYPEWILAKNHCPRNISKQANYSLHHNLRELIERLLHFMFLVAARVKGNR